MFWPPQVTKTHSFTQHTHTHWTNNYIHDHALAIILISFTIFTKAKWRPLSGDRLNEALMTTTGITARLRNTKKPSGGLGLLQKARHSGWLAWNWICSDPSSWIWQNEGMKQEGLRPASRYFLGKSQRSDAHIVVLRIKHGKKGCSLTTYYTQPVFLYFSFFPFSRLFPIQGRTLHVKQSSYVHRECLTALWVSSLYLGDNNKRTTAMESLLTSPPLHCHS